jgi:hypothetical protein
MKREQKGARPAIARRAPSETSPVDVSEPVALVSEVHELGRAEVAP